MKKPFPKKFENDLQGPRVLTSINFNKDLWHEFKMLAARENRPAGSIINEMMFEYLKVHSQGNPQHLITSSMENEDFIGFPSIAIDYTNKQSYLSKHCVEPNDRDKLNRFGNELWSHVTQWYHLMEKL